jgi:Undecaprenyl-phosphate glucose phosphotransferase
MIRGRLKRAQCLLTLAVFLAPLFAFSIAAYFRFATHLLPRYSTDADPSAYFGLLLVTTILWAIAAEHYGLTSVEDLLLVKGKGGRVFAASLFTYVAALSVTFFYRATSFSRVFTWLSALNLFLVTLVVHTLFIWVWSRKRSRQKAAFHVLIVGADGFALRVANALLSDRVATCSVKGFVRLPGQISAITSAPVYEFSDINSLAIGNGFDDVILALPAANLADLPALRKQLSPICVPMRLVLDVGEAVDGHGRLFSVADLLLLDLQGTPAESTVYTVLKRMFDLVFSACVLICAAPVFALIALAVRLSSPGPILFVQERVGLNGKLFRMFKFRTMKVSPPEDSDARWTVKDDPRCTRLGKILRQSGLDELPQFFNVLKGDMSVVGPRPERPLLVQKFMQSVGSYNRRHYLKVGITGWAQVNGLRGDTSIEKRIEYDLYYVRHWTLAFDLLIVLLTFVRGFTDKNAY